MTPDLFAALAYEGAENRHSVLLLSVLRHLSTDARVALLDDVIASPIDGVAEVEAQHASTAGVFDGWIHWSGKLLVVMEAKVDDPLTREQAERYATWLGERDEPERVLWLVTRDRPEVGELAGSLSIKRGGRVLWTTWTTLANRAFALVESGALGEGDALLLRGLGARLRASGLASSPTKPLDLDALALALDLFPYVVQFRARVLEWLRGLTWLAGWTRETRDPGWTGLSVYGERMLTLAKAAADGQERSVSWWVEVNAPISNPHVWPTGQTHGVQLRVGVRLWHRATVELALESLRAVLGAPNSDAHKAYQSALQHNPAVFDSGTYHEIWWRVPFDPRDLEGTAKRLRDAMEEQAKRMSPLIQGGVSTVGVGAKSGG